MPFDEDEEEEVQPQKSGLKISNKASSKPKKTSAEDFQKQANAANNKITGYSERASELTANFSKTLEDKTLLENKNIFSLDLEKELLSKLINLGIDLNQDPDQEEGMGSISLISLCFRAILKQRDRINNLEYSQLLLNNKIKALEISQIDAKKSGG